MATRQDGRDAPSIWMFPGQGAQYFQMGRELYEDNATYRHWMDRLDAAAADYVGQSLVAVLFDPATAKGASFDYILHSHPALFMTQMALAQTLLAEGFPPPDMLLGASLGEFIAAAFAGVAEPEAMLFDVIKQARLFIEHCGGGAMMVVLDDLVHFHANPGFWAGCELAGINFDRCFVVAGPETAIARVEAALKQRDTGCQRLPVTMAFHASGIDPLRDIFLRSFHAAQITSAMPRLPVLSCLQQSSAEPAARFSPAYWWDVVRQPIDFLATINDCHQRFPQAIYVDCGPAGNMATFTRYALPETTHDRIVPIMTPFGRDSAGLEAARAKLHRLRDVKPLASV